MYNVGAKMREEERLPPPLDGNLDDPWHKTATYIANVTLQTKLEVPYGLGHLHGIRIG